MAGHLGCVDLHAGQDLADGHGRGGDLLREPYREHGDAGLPADDDGLSFVTGQRFGKDAAEHGFAAAGAAPDRDCFGHGNHSSFLPLVRSCFLPCFRFLL